MKKNLAFLAVFGLFVTGTAFAATQTNCIESEDYGSVKECVLNVLSQGHTKIEPIAYVAHAEKSCRHAILNEYSTGDYMVVKYENKPDELPSTDDEVYAWSDTGLYTAFDRKTTFVYINDEKIKVSAVDTALSAEDAAETYANSCTE